MPPAWDNVLFGSQALGATAIDGWRQGFLFAHSDVSGLSLFEETHDGGVRAASRALARLGGNARVVATRA